MNAPMAALAHDYLLTTEEALALIEVVQSKTTPKLLREAYAAPDRFVFTYAAFVNDCERIVASRGRVSIDVEAPSEHVFMNTAGSP